MLPSRETSPGAWMIPGGEAVPAPPPGYVVSFVAFHERGFTMPTCRFLRGILHHYRLCLHHLNPNSILHLSAFVALCEGYLGIDAHFEQIGRAHV